MRHITYWVFPLALLLIVGCDDSAEEDNSQQTDTTSAGSEGTEAASAGPDLEAGAAAYAQYCSLCHGDEGEGYKADQANALNHPEFLATATDAFIRHAIVRGRPGTTMSAWHQDAGGPLDDKGVDDLVAFIRTWEQQDPIDVDDYVPDGEADRGQTIYDIRCLSCHGAEGKEGLFMSISNPEFLATASDGYLHHAIYVGRESAGMPAFGPLLTSQQIDDLIVLIRSWQVDPEEGPVELPVFNPDTMVLNPDGNDPEFELDDEGRVSVEQVEAAYDANAKMVLLDARLPSEYLHGHITGAISMPFYSVGEYLDAFSEDTWVVAYCACPHAESGVAADTLKEAGFTKVTVIDEGYDAWVDDGYPVTEGPNP